MAAMPTTLRNTMPERIRIRMEQLANYPYEESAKAVKALQQRHREKGGFSSDSAPFLAGLAMVPLARKELDDTIDYYLRRKVEEVRRMNPKKGWDEVVIGSGIHAAIYCAVRRAMGHPRPLVIERADRIGGTFAMTSSPSFYLNSRNRRGRLSIPGDQDGALNVIPGAPIQPADLSASEYQRNSDLAYAIRMTLLMHSRAMVTTSVDGVDFAASNPPPSYTKRKYLITLNNGEGYIGTDRIIDARGLDKPQEIVVADGETILNYRQFMRRMDRAFPFQGMRKVAVIGAGDSGKTVIEALLGQGPGTGWSVAALDWIDRIDWYDPELQGNAADWRSCCRSRYEGIGRFFPRTSESQASTKVRPILRSAESIQAGFQGAYVDGEPYDCVVQCLGFKQVAAEPSYLGSLYQAQYRVDTGGRSVAMGYGSSGTGLAAIGPRAAIPMDAYEQQKYGSIAENGTAIFRLAPRTAAFAASKEF